MVWAFYLFICLFIYLYLPGGACGALQADLGGAEALAGISAPWITPGFWSGQRPPAVCMHKLCLMLTYFLTWWEYEIQEHGTVLVCQVQSVLKIPSYTDPLISVLGRTAAVYTLEQSSKQQMDIFGQNPF